MQGSLFDEPQVADEGFDRATFASHLRRLAREHIYLGGSSWKYPGWIGQIYTRSRYLTRGKFSEKLFQDTCLREYAETFPVVCGDFSFYQFPQASFWQKLFTTAPDALRFAFKVPEFITVQTFPNLPRWGSSAGNSNELFLDYRMFEANFLEPLRPYRRRVACLIFEFSPMPRGTFVDSQHFAERLALFLEQLPDDFRYAVEIRNHEFLGPPLFELLRAYRVAYVFNSWTRMPALGEQIESEDAYTSDFLVARALLKPGRLYEEAVKMFEPYERVQEPLSAERSALLRLAEQARLRKQPALLFINNRLEGNAPGTIQGLIEMGL